MFIFLKSQLLKFLWATQQESSVKSINSFIKKLVSLNSNQSTPNIKEANVVKRIEKNTKLNSADDFSETYHFSEPNVIYLYHCRTIKSSTHTHKKVMFIIWFSSFILTNMKKNREMTFSGGNVTQGFWVSMKILKLIVSYRVLLFYSLIKDPCSFLTATYCRLALNLKICQIVTIFCDHLFLK